MRVLYSYQQPVLNEIIQNDIAFSKVAKNQEDILDEQIRN